MPQQAMKDFVADLEKTGQLFRIKEETRVDELPMLMESNPDKRESGLKKNGYMWLISNAILTLR